MLEQHFTRYLQGLKREHQIPVSLELWNGSTVDLTETPRVRLKIKSAAAARLLMKPNLGNLAEAYIEGAIDVDGPIAEVVGIADQLADTGTEAERRHALPVWLSRHTRNSDRKAIQYHYDVSNDFYSKWLDPRMVYSCAYFRTGTEDLATAQIAKLDLICRKLKLLPEERLLDIGCGWGAMVIHAARHYGVRAVGVTLSEQQYELARERVLAARLEDRVEIRLQDYRDVSDGPYDKISSIGMFEHVGLRNLPKYFRIVHDLLREGGVAMNHGITASNVESRGVGRGVGDFIDRYVFPDGELPHVSLAIREMSAAGLELVDAESLRRHYALTCEHWSRRFEQALPNLRTIAGERQTRIWRIYLAGCAMGFARRWINIYQLLAVKSGAETAGLPLTRDYMYDHPLPGR
ncbi:MAG TPA: cyclopropane-fatty-acyl-phospholipid synthase family protein [Lautropia sp.]|nr:cyclopropane-fatty-acyl-phospholipid synthase family protein [Lautropia sp.]